MKSVNMRTLKHDTAAIMKRVALGESLEIRCRNRPVAILKPAEDGKPPGKRPDFRKRLQTIYGDRVLNHSATELLAHERGER